MSKSKWREVAEGNMATREKKIERIIDQKKLLKIVTRKERVNEI